MKFKLWLESQSITIDDSKFKKVILHRAEEYTEMLHDKQHEMSSFNPDTFFQNLKKQLADYPLLNNLLNALESKKVMYIIDQMGKMRNWISQKPYQQSSQLRTLTRQIYTYIDTLKPVDVHVAEQEIYQKANDSMQKTQVEMQKFATLIQSSISNIKWNGSSIKIEPFAMQDEHSKISIEPSTGAEITLGSNEYAPQFTIFQHEGKLNVDDVLEGGDTDFFNTPQLQADYFNLANELKNPGSTKEGKNLTLYTARPKEHRQQYLTAKTLPVNLFLVNDYNHAEGLSHDLSSNEQRDIWKIRINSKYLTQTLDGRIKYYQVTTDDAPIISMQLLN